MRWELAWAKQGLLCLVDHDAALCTGGSLSRLSSLAPTGPLLRYYRLRIVFPDPSSSKYIHYNGVCRVCRRKKKSLRAERGRGVLLKTRCLVLTQFLSSCPVRA